MKRQIRFPSLVIGYLVFTQTRLAILKKKTNTTNHRNTILNILNTNTKKIKNVRFPSLVIGYLVFTQTSLAILKKRQIQLTIEIPS